VDENELTKAENQRLRTENKRLQGEIVDLQKLQETCLHEAHHATEEETCATLLVDIRKDIGTILNETEDIKITNEDIKHEIERL
jgi:hypothetical protein